MNTQEMTQMGRKIIDRVSDTEHRARLEGMIVNPSLADEYVYRELPGGITENELYLRCIEVGKPTMLVGASGSGKTMSPLAYGAFTGMPVAVIEGHNGFDPEQFLSIRDQDETTGRWYHRDSDVALVWRYGGIIVVDEVGRVPAKSQGVFFPMFDIRRRLTMPNREIVKAADELLIVATTNPPSYAGVSDMDEALRDRFSPILDWEYDDKVEAELIDSPSLLKMAKDIRARGDLDGVMSTRNLVEFEDLASDFGWEFARAGLLGRFVDYERVIVAGVLDNHGPNVRAELGLE